MFDRNSLVFSYFRKKVFSTDSMESNTNHSRGCYFYYNKERRQARSKRDHYVIFFNDEKESHLMCVL